MSDFKGAAQAAFFQALNASSAVTDGSDVYQHVPEDTQPQPGQGLVIIGDLSAEPIGGKDGGLDKVTVEVLTVIRDPDQTALTSRQAAVREALEGAEFEEIEGVVLSSPVLESEDGGLGEDGQTYTGIQRFSVFAQKGPPLGPELVTNGDASSGAGWATGDYWVVSGGKFVRDGEPGEPDQLYQGLSVTDGMTLRVTFTLDAISGGSVYARTCATSGTPRTAPGTYTEDLVFAGGGSTFSIFASASNTSAVIDDISVREVL